MNRFQLLERILPFCEESVCCIRNRHQKYGWLYSPEQVKKALEHWRNGTLNDVSFMTKNKKDESFLLKNPTHLGVVPHNNDIVSFFVVDLDAHDGQKDMTVYDNKVERFFNAVPVRFYSKSGKGIKQIYLLKSPVPVNTFVDCIRS